MKRSAGVLDSLIGKKKKPKAEDVEMLEIDVEPMDESEEDDVLEDMAEEKNECVRNMMGLLGADDPSDEDVEEFSMELENFLSMIM